MSIDRLNSAVWAAGFAMAPIEDDPADARLDAAQVKPQAALPAPAGWQSARVPALIAPTGTAGSVRQWLSGLQRRATA
jgi:hypothetical protein